MFSLFSNNTGSVKAGGAIVRLNKKLLYINYEREGTIYELPT
jgi:hypothetical protein